MILLLKGTWTRDVILRKYQKKKKDKLFAFGFYKIADKIYPDEYYSLLIF